MPFTACKHLDVLWNRAPANETLWPCGNISWYGRCEDCGQRVREEYEDPITEDSVAVVGPYAVDESGNILEEQNA